eukprot:4539515-Pleurochrysis_carterae.AAC.1
MGRVVVPDSAAYKRLVSKKEKKAVAAAAVSRANRGAPTGGTTQGGESYELPNGQWCSKGTYH